MSSQRHIIKKQVIDLKLSDKENAFQKQESIRRLYYDKILNALDDLFSEICRKDEYILLDKLELDLGSVNFSEINEEFTEKLRKYFFESIIDKVKRGSIKLSGDIISKEGKLLKSPEILVAKKEKIEKRLNEAEYFFELIKHFVITGTIPWWGSLGEKNIGEIFTSVIDEKKDETAKFIGEISSNPKAVERLVSQFEEPAIRKLLRAVYIDNYQDIEIWEKEITSILNKTDLFRTAGGSIPQCVNYVLLINYQAVKNGTPFERELFFRLIDMIKTKYETEMPAEVLHFIKEIKEAGIRGKIKYFKPDLFKSLEEPAKKEPGIDEEKQGAKKKEQTYQKFKSPKQLKTAKSLWKEPQFPKRVDGKTDTGQEMREEKYSTDDLNINEAEEIEVEEAAEVEEVFISNAGLVLLNPYIPKLFGELIITRGNKFIKKTSRIKAIFILQYLVSGSDKSREYELPLNKLLCGSDISFPVPRENDLSDNEKEECDKLLESAVQNWKALRSTSVKGFRESFLLREGIIECREREYLLKVEHKSHDILLETLPWSISVIKYDWMQKPLYVEWR